MIASIGLRLVIHGCVRTGRAPAGILMQLLGGLLAFGLIRFLFPHNQSEVGGA